MSTGARALIGVAAIVVAVVLFVVLQDSGSDDDSEPATTATEATTAETTTGSGEAETDPEPEKPEKPEKPEIPTIEIRGGEPVGGVAELEYNLGDDIEFYVDSDVADHVHLHGYDIFQDVTPGQRVKFSLPASIEGVFEAELEDRVVPIAEITVNP